VALYSHSHAKSAIAQASINQTDVKAPPTILPNHEEQRRIVERAESLDVSLTLENRHLGKFRQQKHGLMHDLLTGGVRVKVAEPAEATTTQIPA
jgi:restriction endonuclease S subunit